MTLEEAIELHTAHNVARALQGLPTRCLGAVLQEWCDKDEHRNFAYSCRGCGWIFFVSDFKVDDDYGYETTD